MTEESLEMIDIGRTFLIDREFRLINARKIALEVASQNSATNSQLQSYDPFKRQDVKRKSMGNPIMNIFRRPSAAPSSSSGGNSSNQGKVKFSSFWFQNGDNRLIKILLKK